MADEPAAGPPRGSVGKMAISNVYRGCSQGIDTLIAGRVLLVPRREQCRNQVAVPVVYMTLWSASFDDDIVGRESGQMGVQLMCLSLPILLPDAEGTSWPCHSCEAATWY